MLVKHWRILSYLYLIPLCLHVSIELTVTNTISAYLFDFCDGRINPGTFGAALTFRSSGHSGSLMQLSCSILESTSAGQLSSPSGGLSMSPFQLGQCSVSVMLSGALSSSLSTGWGLILLIQRTFNIWVHHSGRSFADTGGGKGDLSGNLDASAPSCWKSDQDALLISSVSKLYPMAVICVFWAWDSFCVAGRFWLPCHTSKKSWTLAFLYNCPSSMCCVVSQLFSVSVISNAG